MKIFYLFFLLIIMINVNAQFTDKVEIYNPEADAVKELENAISEANASGKHIFLQIGGNWCPWCIKFHRFVEENAKLDSILKADYVVLRINYSREQKNEEILSKLKFPQRFGFPVFVILNSNGELIHTQDSGYLEKDKSYDEGKIERFLRNWTVSALKPENYNK